MSIVINNIGLLVTNDPSVGTDGSDKSAMQPS